MRLHASIEHDRHSQPKSAFDLHLYPYIKMFCGVTSVLLPESAKF